MKEDHKPGVTRVIIILFKITFCQIINLPLNRSFCIRPCSWKITTKLTSMIALSRLSRTQAFCPPLLPVILLHTESQVRPAKTADPTQQKLPSPSPHKLR